MVKNIELEQLVINKLTQAQYDALAVKNPGELYFITDATPTKEIEKQLVELSEKVPEPISTYESFPEATAENVGLRVVYTGETIEAPSIENENASVSTVFLDPYLTRGHTFMLVPVELSLDTEPTTVYMWQDVNGAIPPISDDTSGKMLSNNGITYEWTEVVLGEKLPDQTDNEGALLTTDGTNPQWTGFVGHVGDDVFGDKKYAIILDPGNKQTSDIKTGHPRTAINPMGDTASFGTNIGGTASGISSISIGAGSRATNSYTAAVGTNATASGNSSTAVGDGAKATKSNSIQLGQGTNDTENTFSVGLGYSNNYRLLEADGTIPAERMSSTVGTTGQVLTKTDTGMEWQDSAGGGDSLPDQTDNAGKFLTTDGTTASWSDKPLVNNADNESSNPYRRLSIGGNSNLSTATYYTAVGNGAYVSGDGGIAIGGTFNEPGGYNYEAYATRAVGISAISIGISSEANAYNCIAIGCNAYVNGSKSIAIGSHAEATATNAIAIGGYSGGKARAQATAECAIQLGCGTDPGQDCTNSDANTLKVANNNGNFEMMDANGNVPLDRLTYVTDQIGDISTALTSILGE